MVFRHMGKISSSRGWVMFSVLAGVGVAAWIQLDEGGSRNFPLALFASLSTAFLLSASMILTQRTLRNRRRRTQLTAVMAQIHQIMRADLTPEVRFSQILKGLFTLSHCGFEKGAIFLRAAEDTSQQIKRINGAQQKWVLAVAEGAFADGVLAEGVFAPKDQGATNSDNKRNDPSREPGPALASYLAYLDSLVAASGEIQSCEICYCDPCRDLSLEPAQDSGHDSGHHSGHTLNRHPPKPHGHFLVPLVQQGRVEGGMCLYSKSHLGAAPDLKIFLQSLGVILGSQIAASRARAEADRFAFYDQLTDLPNRRLLLDRLHEAFQNSQKNRQLGALIILDLDHFKPVNDLHGHLAGDDFLRTIGQRLAVGLRRRDTVGRYAGDEFAILLEDLGANVEVAQRAVELVAQKVRALITKTVTMADSEISLSASLGIALFPSPDQLNALEVLRQADIALYRSKETGRDSFTVFQASMSTELRGRRVFDQPLRGALERQEFSLQLQAKNNSNGVVQGAEVLLRWEHPELGQISPETFIPLAEESGAILAIGEWVLRQSCILLAQIDHLGIEYSLSVNVSPRQLRQPGFVEMVQQILEETEAPASRLTLEVTESQFLSNMEGVISTLKELRSLGVRISIDDFGTGYSCLFYLQKLPLDELKIDQSFIQSAPREASHAVLIDTILTLSRQLGLAVVAEGIETKAQLEFLVERGCTLFQGYYFGQPQPVAAFLATLDSRFGEPRKVFAAETLVPAKDRADNAR